MSANINFVKSQILADIDARIRDIDESKAMLLAMRRQATGEVAVVSGESQSGVSTGFRNAIREALKSRPQGLTGKEIVQELKSSGELSKYKGQVKPSVRVHNELYSLGKKGEVVKKDKRYRLKDMRS